MRRTAVVKEHLPHVSTAGGRPKKARFLAVQHQQHNSLIELDKKLIQR